jgi:mRNA interferase MazF
MVISRFEVYLVNLDPTVGSEIRKTRPCLVVSPDEVNHTIRTVIIAPMTTKGQTYPTRIPCRFKGKDGQVVLDQIRTVDQSRLIAKLGRVGSAVLPLLPCWTCSRKCSNHRWTASLSRANTDVGAFSWRIPFSRRPSFERAKENPIRWRRERSALAKRSTRDGDRRHQGRFETIK